MFRLEALGNFVILKVQKKEAKKGSIVLPDSAAEGNQDFALVVSVGPLCSGGLVEGDIVLCPEYGEYEWIDEEDGDQGYIIVEESAVPARRR